MHIYLLIDDLAVVTAGLAAGVGAQAPGRGQGISMRLVDPDVIDRTTGAVRDVEAFVELSPLTVTGLLGASQTLAGQPQPVAAVLLHRTSRRAVVAGPFDDVAMARSWWSAPANRLAGNRAMVMLVLPFLGAGPAVEQVG